MVDFLRAFGTWGHNNNNNNNDEDDNDNNNNKWLFFANTLYSIFRQNAAVKRHKKMSKQRESSIESVVTKCNINNNDSDSNQQQQQLTT